MIRSKKTWTRPSGWTEETRTQERMTQIRMAQV